MQRSGFADLSDLAQLQPAISTAGQSSKSAPATSQNMRSATSSLASAAGLSHSDLPGGLTTDLFGPAPARVSRSRQQDAGAASQTNAISGRRGSVSSASAALQRSLESRLIARSFGSTTHLLTWKVLVTPAQRQICRLHARAHLKIAPGSGSYPTPRASGGKAGPDYAKTGRSKTGLSLPTVLGGMPNPAWLAWLMGYPAQWISAAPSGMPLSRTLQRSS